MLREELKKAILDLEQSDQKKLLMDLLPEMLPRLCTDDSCLSMIRDFINEETAKEYKKQHMGGI